MEAGTVPPGPHPSQYPGYVPGCSQVRPDQSLVLDDHPTQLICILDFCLSTYKHKRHSRAIWYVFSHGKVIQIRPRRMYLSSKRGQKELQANDATLFSASTRPAFKYIWNVSVLPEHRRKSDTRLVSWCQKWPLENVSSFQSNKYEQNV